MFDTYGPFPMERHDQHAFDELFKLIKAQREDLQYGIGVYIVAAKDSKGSLLPYYVGRTENEFGSRLVQHFRAQKFVPLFENGPISIFLLPRATPRGRIRKANEQIKHDGLKSIRQLEFTLIGACLKLNRALMNKQEARFHDSMHVAGFIDAGPTDRDFPAAQALSELLHT